MKIINLCMILLSSSIIHYIHGAAVPAQPKFSISASNYVKLANDTQGYLACIDKELYFLNMCEKKKPQEYLPLLHSKSALINTWVYYVGGILHAPVPQHIHILANKVFKRLSSLKQTIANLNTQKNDEPLVISSEVHSSAYPFKNHQGSIATFLGSSYGQAYLQETKESPSPEK